MSESGLVIPVRSLCGRCWQVQRISTVNGQGDVLQAHQINQPLTDILQPRLLPLLCIEV